MANYTTNYNLEMPEKNEFYNVDVQNQNMQKIDTAIFEAGNNPELEGNVAGLVEKIGNTTDVGGSNTAGSAMAKLNALLKTMGSSNTSLADLIISLSNRGMVKSVQRGTAAIISGTTKAITISAVNINKSVVVLNGARKFSSSGGTTNIFPFYLSSFASTSITIKTEEMSGANITAGTEYCSWQVIEFY